VNNHTRPLTEAQPSPPIDLQLEALFRTAPRARPAFEAALRRRLVESPPRQPSVWRRVVWLLEDALAVPAALRARPTSLLVAAALLMLLGLPAAVGLAGGLPPVLRPSAREAMDRDVLSASGALGGIEGWTFPVQGSNFISTPFRGATPFGVDHPGLDIAARLGTPVVAAAGGTVVYAAYGDNVAWPLDYGVVVALRHSPRVLSVYAQLEESLESMGIRVGRTVTAGTLIGRIGRTGRSTGPHLHFEVRVDGRPIDPTWLNLRVP
jgi:murein DD-endopeptidase MepM/ murein hydrolase activator NlpD